MKKALILLLLAGMIAPVFAEDAKVLPQGVGRFYLVPGFAWANAEYDSDGDRQDLDDPIQFANVAAALEYGVLPWMSAGLKWIPGAVYYSDLGSTDSGSDISANDVSDVEIGFKTQIVGPNAPVISDSFRWVVTPGVLIPTSGPDWESEFENSQSGDDFVAQAAANHTLGLGFQSAVDYVVNENFFISLFGEGRFYQAKEYRDVGLQAYGTYATIENTSSFDVEGTGTALDGQTIQNVSVAGPSEDVHLGYDVNIELSPHYEKTLSPGVQFAASLPVDFRYTPGLSFADDYEADADFSSATIGGDPWEAVTDETTRASLESGFEDSVTSNAESVFDDTDSYSLTVTPGVSMFFTALPLPIEVTLDWAVPVIGTNGIAQNSVSSQIRFYFAF